MIRYTDLKVCWWGMRPYHSSHRRTLLLIVEEEVVLEPATSGVVLASTRPVHYTSDLAPMFSESKFTRGSKA